MEDARGAHPARGVARPQVPRVRRQLHRAARELTADAVEAARRRQQLEGAVLAQIHALAVRIRERARKQGRTPLGKPLEYEDDEDAAMGGDAPMTLVELIQASAAVFEKHGIKAPDDAMFHRHLLTLSMDPEKDWKKKIEAFVVRQQPKVRRLCVDGDGRRESMGGKSDTNAAVARTRRAMEEGGGHDRRESFGGFETPVRHRVVPLQKAAHTTERDKKTPDRFEDLLLASQWYVQKDTARSKENQVRNAVAGHSNEHAGHHPEARSENDRLKSDHNRTKATDADFEDGDDELTRRGEGNEKGGRQFVSEEDPQPFRSLTPGFHLMATTFQQWRELTAFQRLVREGRQREIRLAQSVLAPAAIFAVFKWISVSLPLSTARAIDDVVRPTEIPSFILTCGLEIRDVSSLRRFGDRNLKWIARRGFSTWAAYARASKAMRIKSLIRHRTRELETASECLHQWWKVARARKRSKCHAVWVESIRARRSLRRHLNVWKKAMDIRRNEHNADDVFRHTLLHSILFGWLTFVKRSRDARVLGSRNIRRRVFIHWKQVTSAEREARRLEGLLDASLRKRLVVKVWGRWRTWAKTHHTQRSLVARARQKSSLVIAKVILTIWRQYANTTASLREKRQRFERWRHNRLKLMMVQEWQAYTQQCRVWEEQIIACQAQQNHHVLTAAWGILRDSYNATIENDAARVQAWNRQRRAVLWKRWKRQTGVLAVTKQLRKANDEESRRTTLRKWKQQVQESQQRRRLICEWRIERHARIKRLVFDTLVATRIHGVTNRQAAKTFLDQRRKSHLQACVNNWRRYSKSHQLRRGKETALTVTWRRIELRNRWTLWRRCFYVEHSISRAEMMIKTRIQRSCFSKWKARLAQSRLQEHRIETLRNYKLHRSIIQWQRALVSKWQLQKCSDSVKSLRRVHLAQLAWQEWRRMRDECREKHDRIAYAVSQWKNRRLRVFFFEWSCTIRRRKRYKQTVMSWQERLKGKSVSLCWQAWVIYVALQQRKRNNTLIGEAYHTRRRLNQAIGRWRKLCIKSKSRVSILRKCVDQWTSCRKRQVLAQWQAFLCIRRLSRYALGRLQGKTLNQCFHAWKGWRNDRLIMRLKFSRSVGDFRRWQTSQAVRRLHVHATMCKRIRYFQIVIKSAGAKGIVLTTFRLWKQFVLLPRTIQSHEIARQTHIMAFRTQRCIRQWVRFVHVRKLVQTTLVQVENLSAASRLRVVLGAWKKFVCQRRFVAALKQKAVVFRAFSLLPSSFNAWVRYTHAQKRTKRTLLHATQLIRHRLEAQACMAWKDFTVLAKLTRRSVHVWQNQTLTKSFARWKVYKVMSRHKRTAIRYNMSKTRHRVLQGWYETVHRLKLLTQFTELWRTRSSRTCFERWTRHVKVIKSARAMMNRLQNTTVSRTFNSWRSLIQDQVQTSANIRERFALMWNQDRKMTSFQKWKAFTTLQRQLKRQILNRLQQRSRRYFSTWKNCVTRQKRLRASARTVDERQKLCLLRTSYVQWRHQQGIRDAMKKIQRRFVEVSGSYLQKLVFISWHSFVVKRRRVKSAFSSRDVTMVSAAFTRWKTDYIHRCRKERALAIQVQKQHEVVLKRTVLTKMRSRVHLKAVCTSVFLPHWQNYVMSQVWAAWMAYHTRKQQSAVRVLELRRYVTRGGRSALEVATTCLRRWNRLGECKLFAAWYDAVEERKWLRMNTAIALQLWQSKQSSLLFYSWREQTETRKKKRVVFARYAKHRQARVWRSWVAFTRQRKLAAVQEAIISRSRTRKRQAAIVQEWRRLVARKHHQSLVQAALALRRTHGIVREWHAFAVARRADRMRLTVASVAYQHKILCCIWQQWREYVAQVRSHRQELQQNTERLQVLILCSVFRAWRAWSHRERTLDRVATALVGRCDAQTSQRVFRAWAGYASRKANAVRVADRFQFTRRARMAISEFRAFVHHKKAHLAAVEKGRKWVEVLGGRHLALSFRLWKQFAVLQKRSRRVVRRYNMQILLPRAWRAWKAFVSLRCVKSDRLERALGCWRSSFVRRAWHAWALYRQEQLAQRRGLVTASTHFASTLSRSVMVKWRTAVVKKQLLGSTCHKLIMRWKLQASYKCLSAWQRFTLENKTTRLNAIVVTSRVTAAVARQAWAEWRRHFIVIQVCKRKQLRRVWDRWTSFIDENNSWQLFQEQQRGALVRKVHIPRAIRQWRAFVVEEKLAKAMSLLSSRFSRDNLVKRCFENWLAFLVLRQKEKELMKRVLKWMHSRNLLRAFRSLSAYAEQQRQKKAMMLQAVGHAQQVLMRKRFGAWRHVVATLKSHREKLHHYVSLMQHVGQRRSFFAWREFVSKRQQLKATCATILSQRAMLTTRRVVDEWLSFTHNAKRRRRADQHYAGRACEQFWRRWKRFLILSRIERVLGASEQRLVETSFVEWRKRAILNKNARSMGAEKRRRDGTATLTTCFMVWRQWSRIQATCSTLLASVAVSNHLRFRFLLWKAFAAQRLKLKRLVHGYSALGDAVPSSPADDSVSNEVSGVNMPTDSPSVRLARIARVLQRFALDWDNLSTPWHRWRNAFHASLFHRMRGMYQSFTAWSTWSQRRQYVKRTLRRQCAVRRTKLMQTTLRTWRHIVVTVKRIRQERRRERELLAIVNAQILRLERKSLQDHWSAWRQLVEEKHHLVTSLMAYQRARVLTKFWLIWSHDFVGIMKQMHTRHMAKRYEIDMFKARRAVQTWVAHRNWKKRTRQAVSMMTHNRHARLRERFFIAWLGFYKMRAGINGLRGRRRVRALQTVIATWRAWRDAQRKQQLRIEAFIYSRERMIKQRTWRQWGMFVCRRHRCDALDATATEFLMRRCVRQRWLRFTRVRIMSREQRKRVGAALALWKKQRAVTHWHDTSYHARLERLRRGILLRKYMNQWVSHTREAIAVRFEAFQARKRLRVVMTKWHEYTQRRRVLHLVEGDLMRARLVKNMGDVWRFWVRYVEHKRKKQLADSHCVRVLKLKWLLHWYDAVRALQLGWDARVEVAQSHYEDQLKRSSVMKWRQGVKTQRQHHAVLMACMVKLTRVVHRRLVQVVLHEWAAVADESRFTYECAKVLTHRRLQRSVLKWRRRIAKWRRLDQLHQDAVAYHRRRLLSAPFFHWQNYALAWNDAEAAGHHKPRERKPSPVAPLPPRVHIPSAIHPTSHGEDDEDEDQAAFRRPLSPMAKRFRKKKQKLLHEHMSDAGLDAASPPLPPLADVATLSLDVKKRLLLLGKWKPSQRSLAQ